MQEFTFIPLDVFSPLFQPVKIFLNLSAAIRSINNPSSFVSTANLISASSLLLHPNCRKKGMRQTRLRLSRWGTVGVARGGDSGPIVASTAPVPPGRLLSLLVRGRGLRRMSYLNHRTTSFVKHTLLSFLSSLSLQSRNSGVWLVQGELLLARRDCFSLFSKSPHLAACRGVFSTLPACRCWDLKFCLI